VPDFCLFAFFIAAAVWAGDVSRETFGHLTVEQMTGILGNSSGVQSYLQK